VLAWGANPGGVLGQGKSANDLVSLALPTVVKDQAGQAELMGIVAVSAGVGSALALTEDGEVWSWGNNGEAELGRVIANGDSLPGKVRNPANTGNLSHIVAISMGDSNAMALADDGRVYAWGKYTGQNTPGLNKYPILLVGVAGTAELANVVAISAGWNWSAALTSEGKVVSWGFNSSGRTGQDLTATVVTPGYVVGADGSPITGIVSISAGYNFGLSLTSTGQVYAWGENNYGQSGQNTQNIISKRALLVKGVGGTGLLGNIKMVAAGGNHGLALDNDNKVFSWGYSQNGQLGDGANHPLVNQSLLPGPVVAESGVGQLTGMVTIAAGYSHSLALAGDGSLTIWGDGFRGNLGQGGTSDALTYVPIKVKNAAGTGALSLSPLSYWPNLTLRGR